VISGYHHLLDILSTTSYISILVDTNIDTEDLSLFFSTLADPTRLKLFQLLCRQKEPDALCVNALAYILGVSQSAVSQHLRVLRSAGLVRGERKGYRVHYFVNRKALERYQELMLSSLSRGKETDVENGQKHVITEQ
jgi:DNA-binding transcriptional ArsR family regulator